MATKQQEQEAWHGLVPYCHHLIGIQLEFSASRIQARMRGQIALLLLHKDLIVSLAVAKTMHGLTHGIRNDFEAATTLQQWRILLLRWQLCLLPLLLLPLLTLLVIAAAVILATSLVLNDAEQLQALAHDVDHQQNDQIAGKQILAWRQEQHPDPELHWALALSQYESDGLWLGLGVLPVQEPNDE